LTAGDDSTDTNDAAGNEAAVLGAELPVEVAEAGDDGLAAQPEKQTCSGSSFILYNV
jgi:H2-forming N5,N10-methylenetetrahydromethanopterin dehydrogenase-like enzyme